MSRLLMAVATFLFAIAAICAFGFHAHEPLAVVLGLDSAGLACVGGSFLA